jgi:hypothetical protein
MQEEHEYPSEFWIEHLNFGHQLGFGANGRIVMIFFKQQSMRLLFGIY